MYVVADTRWLARATSLGDLRCGCREYDRCEVQEPDGLVAVESMSGWPGPGLLITITNTEIRGLSAST